MRKKEHQIYKEWRKCGYKFRKLVNRWQLIFSSNKGVISCVYFPEYFPGESFWEIYCLAGNLFEDCERFCTLRKAKSRCKQLLD